MPKHRPSTPELRDEYSPEAYPQGFIRRLLGCLCAEHFFGHCQIVGGVGEGRVDCQRLAVGDRGGLGHSRVDIAVAEAQERGRMSGITFQPGLVKSAAWV